MTFNPAMAGKAQQVSPSEGSGSRTTTFPLLNKHVASVVIPLREGRAMLTWLLAIVAAPLPSQPQVGWRRPSSVAAGAFQRARAAAGDGWPPDAAATRTAPPTQRALDGHNSATARNAPGGRVRSPTAAVPPTLRPPVPPRGASGPASPCARPTPQRAPPGAHRGRRGVATPRVPTGRTRRAAAARRRGSGTREGPCVALPRGHACAPPRGWRYGEGPAAHRRGP